MHPCFPISARGWRNDPRSRSSRLGGSGEQYSGDLMLAFSTGNRGIPPYGWDEDADTATPEVPLRMVAPQLMTRLFDLTIEATEEAIVNALVAATTLTGHNGVTAHALDHNLFLRHSAPSDPRRSHDRDHHDLGTTPHWPARPVGIVFMVIAAAAPLTVIGGNMPLAMGLGNGAGAPVGFLIAALVLLVFSIGFVTMTPYVPEAGAFFSYVTVGLGQRMGKGIAVVALIAYTAIQVGIYGYIGWAIDDTVGFYGGPANTLACLLIRGAARSSHCSATATSNSAPRFSAWPWPWRSASSCCSTSRSSPTLARPA